MFNLQREIITRATSPRQPCCRAIAKANGHMWSGVLAPSAHTQRSPSTEVGWKKWIKNTDDFDIHSLAPFFSVSFCWGLRHFFASLRRAQMVAPRCQGFADLLPDWKPRRAWHQPQLMDLLSCWGIWGYRKPGLQNLSQNMLKSWFHNDFSWFLNIWIPTVQKVIDFSLGKKERYRLSAVVSRLDVGW